MALMGHRTILRRTDLLPLRYQRNQINRCKNPFLHSGMYSAKLVARVDKGQGLRDCFLISVPLALSSKLDDIEQSIAYLTEHIQELHEVYRIVATVHTRDAVQYTLDAGTLIKNERDAFTNDINNAILDGETTLPKSKRLDLLLRLAAMFHVFEHVLQNALAGHIDDLTIPTVITKDTLNEAKLYVDYVESQKHVV